MMTPVKGDALDPDVEDRYMNAVRESWPKAASPERIDRFAFYERARRSFAVVMTGETGIYGNIIIKKGVTPC